jgi:hypothetical protein
MPRCRPCHKQRLGGRPQENQQLVKYQPGVAPRMLVKTPGFVGVYNQKYIHQHLPNLFHDAKNRGDRVLDPMKWFQQFLQNAGDPQYVNGAIEWVLSRVELYQNHPHHTRHTFNVPSLINYFLLFLNNIKGAYRYQNAQLAQTIVDAALQLLQTVAIVLRSDVGFSFSKRLLEDYCEAGRRLLPYIANFEPAGIFDVLRSAYELSGEDPYVVTLLCQVLGPQDLLEARNSAYVASRYDYLAQDMLPHIR